MTKCSLSYYSSYFKGVPDTQLTYGRTLFGYFSDSPPIDWYTAQLRCLDWGGNLATIKSPVEDILLLYSVADLDETFTCHIGLNDIDYEAGTDGSMFVWIDGSNNAYRNFGTLLHNFPRSIDDHHCVRHRYKAGGIGTLSQGWFNAPCTDERNCYFCTKPGKERFLIINQYVNDNTL